MDKRIGENRLTERKIKIMDKQYAVIGLGKFGYAVAQTLSQAGKQVLAVDKDQELVQEIADYVTYAARADVTDSRVFGDHRDLGRYGVKYSGDIAGKRGRCSAGNRQGDESDACQDSEKDRCRPCSDGRNRNGYPSW